LHYLKKGLLIPYIGKKAKQKKNLINCLAISSYFSFACVGPYVIDTREETNIIPKTSINVKPHVLLYLKTYNPDTINPIIEPAINPPDKGAILFI